MRSDKKKYSLKKIYDLKIIKKMVDVVNKDSFYLALFICFCIISVSVVWTVKNNIQKMDDIYDKGNAEYIEGVESNDITLSDENTQPVQGEQTIEEESQPVVVSESPTDDIPVNQEAGETRVVSNKPVLTMPVEGEICLEYADNTVVYSKTLDQYIIHTGIDIESPLDTPVCAAGDGTILKIKEDKKMGKTIEIQHNNDMVTIYSNLSTLEMVSEGDVVKQGDVISGVGETAIFEILEVPHLHFEVKINDKNENPKNYLK